MKTILTFSFILSVFISLSQDMNGNNSSFNLGVILQPNLAYRRLFEVEKTEFSQFIIDSRNNREIIKFGYDIGINTEMKLTTNLFLETGINYSNKGYKSKKIEAVFFQPDPTGLTHFQSVTNHHYIQVPIVFNYCLGKGKLKLVSSIGIGVNILFTSSFKNIKYYSNNQKKSEINKINNQIVKYNKLNINPTIGVGVDYVINQNSKIRILPIFNYGILKIIDAPISANLWSSGIQIGYYFGL